MQTSYPPYFLQTAEWLEFWKKASGPGHDYFLEQTDDLAAFVYEYPWQLGQKFWYLPKGPILKNHLQTLDKTSIETQFRQLLTRVVEKAKASSVTHIKIDFDDTLSAVLGFASINELESYLRLKLPEIGSRINLKSRKIQYLQCTVCNISHLYRPEPDMSLTEFYHNTTEFWITTNERVRRYSRKTLKLVENGDYTVSIDKTEQNFEDFWLVHEQTARRQGFSTQSKEYLRQMCFSSLGRILVIRDRQGNPHTVWLGVADKTTLYYLCGGNTDSSFKNHLQYLLHIAALRMARTEELDYYDLGGYDPVSGYGQFKDGYRGQTREFVGPVDLIINSFAYHTVSSAIRLKNSLRK